MRVGQQRRLAAESAEEREARLEQIRVSQQQRLACETTEDREARHQQDRQAHMQQRRSATSELPIFQQPGVRSKMRTFHSKLAALQASKCITCSERFPGLSVTTVSPNTDDTECLRCRRDKYIPKLYASANNMNPGPVPPELLVMSNLKSACSMYIYIHISWTIIVYPATGIFRVLRPSLKHPVVCGKH